MSIFSAPGSDGNVLGEFASSVTAMNNDHSMLYGAPSSAPLPSTGRELGWGDWDQSHTAFDVSTGDDVGRNLPLISAAMVAELDDGSQLDRRPGDLLFVLDPHKSTTGKYVIVDLAGVNARLRQAAYRKQQSQASDALASALGASGAAASALNKRIYEDVLYGATGGVAGSTRSTHANIDEDGQCTSVRDAFESWRFLGVMASDLSMPNSPERMFGWQWGGRAKLPYIFDEKVGTKGGDQIGIEYYLATDLKDRAVYDARGNAIEGRTVSSAVQIRVVNLGSRRAMPQFPAVALAPDGGVNGGARNNTLAPRALTVVKPPAAAAAAAGAAQALDDWSVEASLKKLNAHNRGGHTTEIKSDAVLESSITVPIGVISVLPMQPAAEAQVKRAHVSSRAYQDMVGRQYMIVTLKRQRLRF